MKAYLSTLCLPGVTQIEENPLPVFRDLTHEKDVRSNGTLLPDELEKFGYETGARVLPYRMQDRYTRDKKPVQLTTVVLENDRLRATFLADYGGRLYSLADRRTGRELLFKNPVFQPANLAIRNAWFSGGIEWNIGQLGHTFTTCSPLFFAKLTDEEGNEFLRMYEYERQKRLFWQIDFHLPKGSAFLQAYVRIVNDRPESTPMYWWTNIACREDAKTRIFSSAREAVYQDKETVFRWIKEHGMQVDGATIRKAPNFFGHGELPYLKSANGQQLPFDVSYPQNYQRSNEYFFKNPKDLPSPWEAAVYDDGFIFFERSTQPLAYRKMFCWGTHRGGRKWCDYLALPGQGDYVEIQGGLAPTQVHGMDMPPESTIAFSQLFGCTQAQEPARLYDEWERSQAYVSAQLEQALPAGEVLAIHQKLAACAELPPAELLHLGSGWGALEQKRRQQAGERPIPAGFLFPDCTLGAQQAPWLTLLQQGYLPELAPDALPASYLVDPAWRPLLEKSLSSGQGCHVDALNSLGVLLYENGEREAAKDCWLKSCALRENPLAYRNLGCMSAQLGDADGALRALEKAFALEQGRIDKAFAEEYLQLLVEHGDYQKVWEVFSSLPEAAQRCERIQILAGQAAIEVGEYAYLDRLFERELAIIREGETVITDLWFRAQAIHMAQERGVPYSEEILREAQQTLTPPGIIDLRMSTII